MVQTMKKPLHRFALVRGIPDTFDQCIKHLDDPQSIDLDRARFQHGEYCQTLSRLGFELIALPPDGRDPDCAFVEDAAVIVDEKAILTHPGAESRRGQVEAVREVLARHREIDQIGPPGFLEGGDVLQAEDCLFVGITERTNLEGFRQLKGLLAGIPVRVIPVPMRKTLHLKTAFNYLGKGIMVVNEFDFDPAILSGFEILQSDPREAKKLSFLPTDKAVLVPDDCPRTREDFEKRGFGTNLLGLSEIRKAQAGLTCMSVLFRA